MSETGPDLLTAEELALFAHLPEGDLVELAAELDMTVPESIDRPRLLDQVVVAIAQLARHQGLPLSSYDRADLEALPPEELRALASLCGAAPSVDALIKAGAKVYKTYRKTRPNSPIPLVLPMLLPALARYAHATERR